MLIGTINDMLDGESVEEQLCRDLVVLLFAHAIVSNPHYPALGQPSRIMGDAQTLADKYLQESSK